MRFIAALAAFFGTVVAILADDLTVVLVGAGIALWGLLLGIWGEVRALRRVLQRR